MFEFGLVPQLFYAFDCAALCLEFFPGFFSRVDESVIYEFLEAAEEAGVPSDTCSTDRFIVGATARQRRNGPRRLIASSRPAPALAVPRFGQPS